MPAEFDPPLAAGHRMLGAWAARQEDGNALYSRAEARRRIEQQFNDAVLAILRPVELADLRAVVLHGYDGDPPAIALICDSIGQIDMGWIEKSNVLSNTLFGTVAPVSWRATAYRELAGALPMVLPIFGFDELLDELSLYYWDGEITDEGARHALTTFMGFGPEDIDEMTMPSAITARRPDWMLASNATALKNLPKPLAQRLRSLRAAHAMLKAETWEDSAWSFDGYKIIEYLPHMEDRSMLPSMTLVPFEDFARELDDVAQVGMQEGFMNVAGLCLLSSPDKVDAWFASLKLGVDVLLAAQALIDLDPSKM